MWVGRQGKDKREVFFFFFKFVYCFLVIKGNLGIIIKLSFSIIIIFYTHLKDIMLGFCIC